MNNPIRFNGSDYNPALDNNRLSNQIGRIFTCMISGEYRTLSEIAEITNDHEASISAQLRHLRKPRFGGYIVEKRRRGVPSSGLFEYRLLKPEKNNQLELKDLC